MNGSKSSNDPRKIADFCQEFLALAVDWWWVHDYETNEVAVSPSVTTSLGYRVDEITTPDSLAKIMHESDWPEADASAKSAVRTMAPNQVRIRFRTKGGVWRTTLCRMRPILDDDGVPSAMIGIVREIDDIVAIESEIMARNDDLVQVASVLSHDFRGPARHITGCVERIVEQVEELKVALSNGQALDFEVLLNWTRLTHGSAERLGRMIEHVLQYSRAGTKGISAENVEVADVVDTIVKDYADKIAERNVVVRVMRLPIVYYDETMLYLVLANLISNAIKFSKKDDTSPVVTIDGRNSVGEWASISIVDHGIGFPPSQREKILEMGFRLHHERDFSGFGYGLAIVKKILTRCGGQLGVRSQVGDGSEFVLKLPAGRLVR